MTGWPCVLGRSSPAATRTQAVEQPADGSASLLQSVTGFEVGSLVRIFQEQETGNLQTHRVVVAVDAGRKLVAWDAPLNTGLPPESSFQLGAGIPLFLETIVFSLAVYRSGRLHELFADLSLVVDHPRANVGRGGGQRRLRT